MKAALKYLAVIPALLFLAGAFWAGWFWQEMRFQARLKAGPPATPGIVLNPGGAGLKKSDLLASQRNHITARGEANLPVHRGAMGRQPAGNSGALPAGMGLPAVLQPGKTSPSVAAPTFAPTLKPAAVPTPAAVSRPTVTPSQPDGIQQPQTQPRFPSGEPAAREDPKPRGALPPLAQVPVAPPLAPLVPVAPHPDEFLGLMPGDSLVVPLAGTIKTEVVNERTGETIAAQTNPVNGTALVKAEKDKLKVETEFDNTLRIGVTPPEPPLKRFHLGAAMKLEEKQTPAMGGYFQYDIPLLLGKSWDLTLPLRVERWPDGWRGSVAVEVRF